MKKKNSKGANQYLKYSGIAFQLFFFLFIAVYAGKYTDAYLGTTKPYFTIVFLLVALVGFFYKIYNDLAREDVDK